MCELQWACGSGGTSYSGPTAVGLLSYSGLHGKLVSPLSQASYCSRQVTAAGSSSGDTNYSGPVTVEVRVTMDLRQWGYELQWAYGNLVSPLSQAYCNSQPHCH